MEKPKNNKTQTGNIKIIKEERDNNYCRLSTYHLQDNRLNTTEQLIFTKLLLLPPNFKISIRKTPKYLNTSIKTFQRAIETFKNLGYLKTEKTKQNEINYTIKEISDTLSEFNVYHLKYYTNQQLNYFLKNTKTPSKYKKVIKMYIDKTKEYEDFFNKLIEESDKELF